MPETYILKIRSGRNKVHKKRLYFWLKDYKHVPRQKNRDFYQKKECSVMEKNRMLRWCRRRGFVLEAVPTKYTRSRSYRAEYFRENPSRAGIYRCVYCGRKLPKEKITVDHIFPIHEMETSAAVRRRAALHGIKGSNDVKNLCAACRRCNLRKGTHMGRWIRKAFLGRMTWYWPVVKISRLAIVCLIVYAFGCWQPDIISFVWESVQKLKF